MSKEALKLALEALESCGAGHITDGGKQWHDEKLVDKAITAIKQALAAPVQEPVASAAYDMVDRFLRNNLSSDADYAEYSAALDALYTTPPNVATPLAAQRQWVGLTDEEANELWEGTDDGDSWELIMRVQAKLKEKNT